MDPVLFGNTANNQTLSKPPSGRSATLTLPLANTNNNYYGGGNNSGNNTNRLPSQRGGSSGQGNTIFPSTGNFGSARGNKSIGPSPVMTGRAQQQTPTSGAAQRRAIAERREEIDMVRQLQ